MLSLSDIADRMEIQELVIRYAQGLDQRNWELWEGLFTSDASLDYRGAGMAVYTPPEFQAMVTGNDPHRLSGQHIHANLLITLETPFAHVTSEYVMVTMTRSTDGQARRVRAGGIARYSLLKHTGRWRIQERSTTVKWLDRADVEWPVSTPAG